MADLEIKDLVVEYSSGGYAVRPIDGLSLSAATGELVVVLGPSGSGKTTLLSCLAGILSPTCGSIHVAGSDVTQLQGPALADYRRSTVGIVFQAFNLIPSLTALENVEVPLTLAGVSRKEARARATELLHQVGLSDRLSHRPGEMSGGQQQRVAIARALVHDPPLVIADEPTAHLDYIQVESILSLVREIAKPGRLVVVATHDERMIPLADRVIDLSPKVRIASRPPERVVLAAGEALFHQGDAGDLIYVVEEGEVAIVRVRSDHSEELLTTVGVGEHFGELAPLLGLRRTATARAHTVAVVTGYTIVDFRKEAASDPRLARMFAAAGYAEPNGSAGPSKKRAAKRSVKASAARRGKTAKTVVPARGVKTAARRRPR
ncbi:MAG: ATP-binding cassette domain-containing protein [Actinomycetota bacterium]|nr:ATP-binding cassette domain-containing protein [Actinomycetota bacterium]